MHEIRQQLDQAHNVERPKPMGECFTCNAALYSRPGCTDIRCHKCGRRYNGLDIVKLEVQRRREANA
jgi:tRNA(Ile2) C34 agmatinyltransferase TiaS